ncbi:MAG: hypothetical protein P1P84_11825, partial [Deferrisomatales bacterium]|nr:hypothetical protein [Deferrisomatales bacterium]
MSKFSCQSIIVLVSIIVAGSTLAATNPDVLSVNVNGTNLSSGESITLDGFVLGSTFRFKIVTENNGDDSPPLYNNITLSFPQFTSSSDKSRVSLYSKSSDLVAAELFGSEAGGGDGYANYVMVEAQSTDVWDGSDLWPPGAENETLEVTLQPKAYGSFYVYYRVAMSNQESWTSGWTYEPSSGGYLDCLGFSSYRITVIIPPPDTTPPSTVSSLTDGISGWSTDTTPRFTWNDATDTSGILGYWWSVDDSTPQTGGTWLGNTLGGEGVTLPTQTDGTHTFYVCAIDDSPQQNVGPVSSHTFSVDGNAPSVPQLLSPGSGNTVYDQTPYFDWSTSSDGSGSGIGRYDIEIYDGDLSWGDIAASTTASQYTPTENIPYDTVYWRVKAIDNVGRESAWSSARTLYVVEPFAVASISVELNRTSGTTDETYQRRATFSGTG